MRNYPGEDASTLRRLATALAHDSIFGKDALRSSSLRGGGKSKTGSLDKKKLEYIKTVLRTRVPDLSALEYEGVWDKCRSSISKSCQTLRDSAKKKDKVEQTEIL